MRTNHANTRRLFRTLTQLLGLAVAASMFVAVAGAQAAGPPVKLVLATQFGREVNLTQTNLKAGPALEDICTTTSGDSCQPGKESAIAGGLTYPESVAGAPDGDIFVADKGNGRIDEFTASGEFVLMFGKEVDPTAADKDVCTAESKDVCAAGAKGAGPGQLDEPEDVAVDPIGGDVYVAETVVGEAGGQATFGQRVQEFTADGEFLLEIGKEVNAATKGNLCAKGETCTAPTEYPGGAGRENGHGAFNFARGQADLLAVGGEHDRLYVAGIGSIQEFEAGGVWHGEIMLPGKEVTGIAIEPATNAIYAVYDNGDTVHRLDPEGSEISNFTVSPREAGEQAEVLGIAIDRSSHVALAIREEPEEGHSFATTWSGALYEAATGNLLTQFTFDGQQVKGISFNRAETPAKEPADELFASGSNSHDVLAYRPEPVAELSTGSAICAPGDDSGSSATLACTVEGHANPYSVASTRVWLEWGATCALGSETAKQVLASVTEVLPVHATVTGLRPDSAFCYRLAGDDANVLPPEQLTAEKRELKQLPTVPPRVIGAPSVLFVHSSSAVMFGELNPENADTTYEFQYAKACGAEEVCPGLASILGVAVTGALESNAYGKIGATLEATGLRPATVYRYRLHAINEAGEQGECFEGGEAGCEGSFTTAPAPVLTATTEGATAVGATSAVISGSVDPGGQLATYAFELGVYQGAATQYGVVQSGSTETVPVTETLPLSGLQPGTEYAYRITIASGYGTAVGEPVVFRTGGLPSVLAVPAPLAMLATPNVAFPGPAASVNKPALKCKAKYTRNKQGECVKPKSKKKRAKKAKKAEKASARRR